MAPKTEAGDAGIIAAPLDFLGVNNYYRSIISQGPGGIPDGIKQIRREGAEFTEMGWEVYPRGLYDLLTRLHQDYTIPQYFITENGAAFNDTVSEDGHVHDPRRIQYLHDYLLQAQAAIAGGVLLAGYFVWSLMDSLVWVFGYFKRFGFVFLVFSSYRRIIS